MKRVMIVLNWPALLLLVSAHRPPTSVNDRPDFARFFKTEKLTSSFLLYDLKKGAYTAYQLDWCRITEKILAELGIM